MLQNFSDIKFKPIFNVDENQMIPYIDLRIIFNKDWQFSIPNVVCWDEILIEPQEKHGMGRRPNKKWKWSSNESNSYK